MEERPSKYHNRVFIGTGNKGADERGNKWMWNSSHDDLTPTAIVTIEYNNFCAYCAEKAYPIQGRLKEKNRNLGNKKTDWHYKTTGYTCICQKAEKERELDVKLEELLEKQELELHKFKCKYPQVLTVSIQKKLLSIKHKLEKKNLDRGGSTFNVIVKE